MAGSNPVFSNSPAFSSNPKRSAMVVAGSSTAKPTESMTAAELTELYSRPAAGPVETDRMSYEDTVLKTLFSFVILVAGAAVGWFIPGLWIPAAIVGFVLALVNIFKKKPSRALVLSYAAVEGVFVGGISLFYQNLWDGIVVQAVAGTLAIVFITLALFASGKVRASKRATKVFFIAMLGYGAFSLINLGLMAFGVTHSMFGLNSGVTIMGIPLGIVIGVLVVVMCAYSLVLDFENVKTGVERGAPRAYGWTAAFGIMVTVVWLYLEILRIIALARR